MLPVKNSEVCSCWSFKIKAQRWSFSLQTWTTEHWYQYFDFHRIICNLKELSMLRIFLLFLNLLFTISSLLKGHASTLFLFLPPYDSCKLIARQCKENNKCRTMRVWIKAPLPPTTTHPSPSLVGEQEIKHFLALSYPEIYFVIMIIKVIFWHKGYLVWHKIRKFCLHIEFSRLLTLKRLEIIWSPGYVEPGAFGPQWTVALFSSVTQSQSPRSRGSKLRAINSTRNWKNWKNKLQ